MVLRFLGAAYLTLPFDGRTNPTASLVCLNLIVVRWMIGLGHSCSMGGCRCRLIWRCHVAMCFLERT